LRGAAIALAFLARDFDAALSAIDRALTLNPNSAPAYENSGWIRFFVSDWRTSVDHFQKAMRLSPLDPAGMGYFASGLSWALLVGNRPEEALPWAQKAVQDMPTWMGGLRPLIMALVELGRLEEARAVGQRLLALDPKQTVTVAARASAQQDPQFRERFFAALRAAGIPE
jgi:adenylate cyclase